MIRHIKEFREIYAFGMAVIVITVGTWQFLNIKALAQSHDEIIKGQYKIAQQNKVLLEKHDTELAMMFKLGVISQQVFEDLRVLPKSPTDDSGNINHEWYLIAEDAIYLIRIPDNCDADILKIPIYQGDN